MYKHQPLIIFDGLCSLCSFFVQIILKYEKEPVLYFVSLQSEYAKTVLSRFDVDEKGLNTVVLIDSDRLFIKSSAVFKIAAYFKFPLVLIKYFKFIPRFITDFFYDVIARYRYVIFGAVKSCYVPDDISKKRFLG